MQRLKITPRTDQKSKLEAFGYLIESEHEFYWNESACYTFSKKEVDEIESATNALQEICAEAVQTIIDRDWFSRLDLTFREAELAKASWDRDELSLYGRFDLTWDLKTAPKMLEYNADTPTSLFEASILQWEWLEQCQSGKDQFNSLHDKLKMRWPQVIQNKDEKLYFLCLQGNAEEITQTEYLRDVAHQAGLQTEFLFLEDLGWDDQKKFFVDLEGNPVKQAFKLYPWEWLSKESFGDFLSGGSLQWVEPAWKRILSTKAILPVLWELYPGHPNLLPAFFEKPVTGDYVRKPTLSREGSRVSIFKNDSLLMESDGPVESDRFIYQAYQALPVFDGHHVVIGSWIIGEEPAGIGLREDQSPITRNTSRFVPHYFE